MTGNVNILKEIAEKTRERITLEQRAKSIDELKKEALALNKDTGFPFERAVRREGISFICEVKKASPSKGVIAKDFPYVQIAKEYELGGAAAISVLTEPYYFMGSDDYLREIRKNVSIPIIRKDFTIDEYMIYQAKVMGADAVLLICAILDDSELKAYFELSDSLGLTTLVEAHDESEVERSIKSGARIIGVNNRDLKTFTVDINNSIRLRPLVPLDKMFVSESGISSVDDIVRLSENKVDAVLIGETMMRAGESRVYALRELKKGVI